MRRIPLIELLAVAVPPLVLAGLGLLHPSYLTDDSAATWRNLHIALLPIFPLLALAPWIVVRREHRLLRWAVVVLGFVYAVFYTALDVLAGIGAGALQAAGGHDLTSVLFTNANDLAFFGVWAYLVAAATAAAVALGRAGALAVPGSLLVVGGGWSFLSSHIYWPRGGLTMLALALGWAALVLAQRFAPAEESARRRTPPPGRLEFNTDYVK
jgi:hypothetical protein